MKMDVRVVGVPVCAPWAPEHSPQQRRDPAAGRKSPSASSWRPGSHRVCTAWRVVVGTGLPTPQSSGRAPGFAGQVTSACWPAHDTVNHVLPGRRSTLPGPPPALSFEVGTRSCPHGRCPSRSCRWSTSAGSRPTRGFPVLPLRDLPSLLPWPCCLRAWACQLPYINVTWGVAFRCLLFHPIGCLCSSLALAEAVNLEASWEEL